MSDKIFSTFVMSETTINQIKVLSPDIQLKFFWAVTNYGIDAVEPDFTGMELAIWIPMRDLIKSSKAKNDAWLEKQRSNGSKGGRPKTQNNPDEPRETQNNPNSDRDISKSHNVNGNVNINGNVKGKGNGKKNSSGSADAEAAPIEKSSSTAIAVAPEKSTEMVLIPSEKLLVIAKPPGRKKLELTQDQLPLFHAAKACFESSEKAKAMLYQDTETTAREMKHLKMFVIRCSNMAPGLTADFMKGVLEHFKSMVNGKLHGKAVFTPRSLITPWVWELVIDDLPENNITPELRESIKGLFKEKE